MIDQLNSDSINNPKNRICDIVSDEYSQIRRVLAEPLPQPHDSDDSKIRNEAIAERKRQLEERERFVLRYDRAIRAFLGKKLGNAEKIEQVYAFFMQKCMEGKLKGYRPLKKNGEKQSFRVYLKTVLRNCCYEYHRNNMKEDAWVQMESRIAPAQEANDAMADAAFDQELVQTLFQRALDSIERIDHLYHTVLKLVIDAIYRDAKQPSSPELASILSAESGKPVSEQNARKIKSRANKMFSKQLIVEVGDLIKTTDLDEIENALIDIGILKFCKKALSIIRENDSKE